jgi:hypothetical protein
MNSRLVLVERSNRRSSDEQRSLLQFWGTILIVLALVFVFLCTAVSAWLYGSL